MIDRKAKLEIIELLEEFPAVAVLGPRQVGKTTLAAEITGMMNSGSVYLDLESPSQLARLADAEAYLEMQRGKLVILDEIQQVPELFSILRGVIDRRRREGHRTGQFLILGSASLELLKQSSESLAGRIAYKELTGLTLAEVEDEGTPQTELLWLRGGFPDSFLARSDGASLRWRTNFISTYLERDIPQIGPRIPAITLKRLWTMLAHQQGGQINLANLGANLDISVNTVKRYIDLLEDLLLVRTLRPWSGNVGKRLVKSPKIYVRDSGLVHTLLNITSLDDLLAHPILGASWEGFVLENLLSCIPVGATPWFYRTSAGAEIDLIIEFGPTKRYAIEIKRSSSPVASRGFYLGSDDIGAEQRFIVYPGKETFPGANNTTVISIEGMMKLLTG